jgi:LysM repeat protein
MVDNVIPAQGTPGIFDPRNPTLVPNFDKPNISTSNNNNSDPTGTGASALSLTSPAGFLNANPRGEATCTATIGGTVTAADILTIRASNPVFPAGFISHTYTVQAGDTLNDIAEELAGLFDDDTAAANVGLRADVLDAVITFRQGGPVGNFTVLTAPTEEAAKITIAGTALTGDQISVLFTNLGLPITDATALVQIGGTPTTGDTVALTFTNAGVANLPVTKTYTVLAGDTLATIAAGLAALVNADANLGAADIVALVTGNGFEVSQPGAIGNSTVLTQSVGGSATETVTFLPSNGHLGGGAGQPGGVVVTQAVTTGQSATTIAGNLVTAINANAELVAAGISATNNAGVITLVVPAADEPVVVSTWVNSNPLTAVIGGSVAAGGGDVLTLTFTGAGIAGSPVTVSYTTVAGDTTATIAAALGGVVNGTAALQTAGIGASVTSSTITFTLAPAIGQMRLTESVTTGSETITVTATPTTTSTLGTAATETITFSNTNASVVATIVASAPAATDTVALTFTNSGVSGLPVTKTYTLVGADSATVIAAGLVALINADANLSAANIRASNLAGVITITQPGVIGNSTVVSATITETGGGTETCTFTPSNGHMGGGTGSTVSGALSGGTGPIIAANNFTFAAGNSQIQSFWYGQPYVLGYDVVTAMVAQGMPIL